MTYNNNNNNNNLYSTFQTLNVVQSALHDKNCSDEYQQQQILNDLNTSHNIRYKTHRKRQTESHLQHT